MTRTNYRYLVAFAMGGIGAFGLLEGPESSVELSSSRDCSDVTSLYSRKPSYSGHRDRWGGPLTGPGTTGGIFATSAIIWADHEIIFPPV